MQHDFYQTSTDINITLYVPDVDAGLIGTSYSAAQRRLIVTGPQLMWAVDLAADVRHESKRVVASKKRFDIKMDKCAPGQWPGLGVVLPSVLADQVTSSHHNSTAAPKATSESLANDVQDVEFVHYDWQDTASHSAKLVVFIAGLAPARLSVNIQPRSITLQFACHDVRA